MTLNFLKRKPYIKVSINSACQYIMMLSSKSLVISLLILSCCSCNNNNKYPYAIKDFRGGIQPNLFKMVGKGYVMGGNNPLLQKVRDRELLQLSICDQPILRATALREILKRNSFNHFDILMAHLDDTALVAVDMGEFGIDFRTVSDDLLQEARWKTQAAKNKTIDEVIMKHNYLRAAYLALLHLEPQEKYYSFIKDMATRPRRLDPEEGYELGFDDIEYALYGLAKFRKKEDVPIIKATLMKHYYRLGRISFRLIKEYPDTAYFDILQTYHRRRFYRFSGDNKDGFTGNDDNRARSKDFIEAVISQETTKSADILDTVMQRLPSIKCVPNMDYLQDEIILSIWADTSSIYSNIKNKIRSRAEYLISREIEFPVDRINEPIDSTKETIYWDR